MTEMTLAGERDDEFKLLDHVVGPGPGSRPKLRNVQ